MTSTSGDCDSAGGPPIAAGCFVDELDGALYVKTKHCLRQLAERGRVGREA
ncbi:MAG: hypothetical protein JW940_19605 [Polyangiaceae bacterium]|nr:hypothetical protein [Polyangiaceae bacterium]